MNNGREMCTELLSELTDNFEHSLLRGWFMFRFRGAWAMSFVRADKLKVCACEIIVKN